MGVCASAQPKASSLPAVDFSEDAPVGSTPRAITLSHTLQCDDKHVWQVYRRGNLLGQGNFGSVREATHRQSKRRYAIKSIRFTRFSPPNQVRLRKEISVLQKIDHPNVVRIFEVFESKEWLYLVLELCLGRTVVDDILDPEDPTRSMSERETSRCMHKLLLALRYCHAQGIVHRDVKPENFVYEGAARTSEPKLIDFGLSQTATGSAGTSSSMQTFCGTLPYQAPEMFKCDSTNDETYGAKVDVWAVGVTTYFLLCGQIPFTGDGEDKGKWGAAVSAGLGRGKLGFSHARWQHISKEAKAFVRALLQTDPAERVSAEEALQLPWMLLQDAKEKRSLPEGFGAEQTAVLRRIADFQSYGVVKKAALTFIAHRMHAGRKSKADKSRAIVEQLRRHFEQIDTHRTGCISPAELQAALTKCGLISEQFPDLFAALDADRSGAISYSQFLAATMEAQEFDETTYEEAFDSLDIDHSGAITMANLKERLAAWDDREVVAAIEEADLTNDGVVTREEFMEIMKGSARVEEIRRASMERAVAASPLKKKRAPKAEAAAEEEIPAAASTPDEGAAAAAAEGGDAAAEGPPATHAESESDGEEDNALHRGTLGVRSAVLKTWKQHDYALCSDGTLIRERGAERDLVAARADVAHVSFSRSSKTLTLRGPKEWAFRLATDADVDAWRAAFVAAEWPVDSARESAPAAAPAPPAEEVGAETAAAPASAESEVAVDADAGAGVTPSTPASARAAPEGAAAGVMTPRLLSEVQDVMTPGTVAAAEEAIKAAEAAAE